MTCPFLSPRWILAALVLAASTVAFSACSNTDTSAAVQPLVAKNASLPSGFNFQDVSAGASTAVTGINDSQEIVGTYTMTSASNSVTQSFTSTPNTAGLYKTFVGDNYPQPYYGAPLSTSTDLVAVNPGTTTANTFEAGWVVNPGGFGKKATYTLGLVNYEGLWTVLHQFGPEGSVTTSSDCRLMELQGINDSNEAVGYYETNNTSPPGCGEQAIKVLSGENVSNIQTGSLLSSSIATGVDDAGNIVGWGVKLGSSPTTAVGWYKPKSSPLVAISVDNSTFTRVLGISGNGVTIVGSYSVSGKTYGFVCEVSPSSPCSSSADVEAGITACTSYCYTVVSGINDDNDICGYYVPAHATQQGFVATPKIAKLLRRRAAQSRPTRPLQQFSAGQRP
jgi:hypothetical protein